MSDSNPIVNLQDHVVVMEERIPLWLQKHTLNSMQLSFALLGEAADQEPGENMDQLALILSKLSPEDLEQVYKLLGVDPVPAEVMAQLKE